MIHPAWLPMFCMQGRHKWWLTMCRQHMQDIKLLITDSTKKFIRIRRSVFWIQQQHEEELQCVCPECVGRHITSARTTDATHIEEMCYTVSMNRLNRLFFYLCLPRINININKVRVLPPAGCIYPTFSSTVSSVSLWFWFVTALQSSWTCPKESKTHTAPC